ncbi:MAG: hypothetical protein E7608_03000 [Ruminococcaceae bacterium]|nr:hypothetical protein [Oscillospiraceae bacterium]MBO5006274.1 stage III sporulation protein AF [Clostridia bacterium]
MTSFYDFVKSFCITAISGGLAMAVSPEGKIKKYIKYIVSLCVICALLAPFLSFAQKAPTLLDNFGVEIEDASASVSDKAQTSVALEAKKNIEKELSKLVGANFGYKEEDMYIVVAIDGKDPSAVRITDVTLFLSDISRKDEVDEYISELFLNTANIHIMKKGAGT